jgi:hypothetical protein
MTHIPDGEQARAGLAALLDEIRAHATMPAGVRGRIYAILDTLRATGAPVSRIEAVEQIALTVYRLEWARQRKATDEEEALWRRLDTLATEWTTGAPASVLHRMEF